MAAFTDNWTNRLGAPEYLVSDNEFTSQVVRRVCQALNIKHLPTPTYNPRSNAQIERQFCTIKELLRAVTRGLYQKTWNRWLGPVTFAINANVNRVTGMTPFYFMYVMGALHPVTHHSRATPA